MRQGKHDQLAGTSDEWMAGSIARVGHSLGDDVDVTIHSEVFPAAGRLLDVDSVDRCLLRVSRRIDAMTYRHPSNVNLNLAALHLAAMFGVLVAATTATSTSVQWPLFAVAGVLLVTARPMLQRSGASHEEMDALLQVRECYQRRRLDLISTKTRQDGLA